MSNIKKYKMKLIVKSPVHIAGADYKSKLTKNEYYYDFNKKTFYIIDGAKLINELKKRDLFEKYLDHSSRKNSNLAYFLKNNNMSGVVEKISKIKYKDIRFSPKNDFKLFVRDVYGNIYIPGSSIKGAITNSLLVDEIRKNRNKYADYEKRILRISNSKNNFNNKKREISKIVKELTNEILYRDQKSSVNKYGISISDTYASSKLNIKFLQDVDTKRENLNISQNMPVFREYILAGSEFDFDINLNFDYFKNSNLNISSMQDLLDAIYRANGYTIDMVSVGEYDDDYLILGANTGYYQKTVCHAIIKDDRNRENLSKIFLPNKIGKNKVDRRRAKYAPSVLNEVETGGYQDIAGLVELEIEDERDV